MLKFKLRKTTQKLHQNWIIKPHLPWYQRPSVLTSLGIMVLSVLLSYSYIAYTLHSTKIELAELSKKYANLSGKFMDLKITKVKLQRELEVSNNSQIKIKDNLLNLHQKTQELSEQVGIYKKIMSANNKVNNISNILIENLQLKPTGNILNNQDNNNTYYNLSLVLLQASQKRNLQNGKLDIKAEGKLGDISKTLNYSQLTSDKSTYLLYKFNDYQQFNKTIILPNGFEAEKIIISVTDNKTKQTKSKTFDWMIAGGGHLNVAKK